MEKKTLALYILRALARHQMDNRGVTLQVLVDEIGVRRGDVRSAVTALHEQGYLDALRLRLTMAGFAVGVGLVGAKLPPLRLGTLSRIAA